MRTISAMFVLVALITGSLIVTEAIADNYPVEIVRLYSRESGEFAEGITVDQNGTIYVSIADQGQIWEQPVDGSEPILVTSFGEERPLGLAVDRYGDLYVALRSYNPDTQGVYRVNTLDGSYERLPFTDAINHPNGLAFDKKGNLYVTDSIIGAVWRIPENGDDAELWLVHPYLKGVNYPQLPHNYHVGANGIAYWRHGLYVAVTEQGSLVYIPIKHNGKAGRPEIIVQNQAELITIDGIALDFEGNIYACLIGWHKVVKIDPLDGYITTLATIEDGLDYPSSLVFGRKQYRTSLFISNYAAWPKNETGPGVLRIDVGVPGKRLP